MFDRAQPPEAIIVLFLTGPDPHATFGEAVSSLNSEDLSFSSETSAGELSPSLDVPD